MLHRDFKLSMILLLLPLGLEHGWGGEQVTPPLETPPGLTESEAQWLQELSKGKLQGPLLGARELGPDVRVESLPQKLNPGPQNKEIEQLIAQLGSEKETPNTHEVKTLSLSSRCPTGNEK